MIDSCRSPSFLYLLLRGSVPPGIENDPVLYPAWCGQHDDWLAVATEDNAAAKVTVLDNTNVAIQGLFKYIEPGSAEAFLASPARIAQWGSEFMIGYTDADYAAKKAPIYLVPMEENVCLTSGLKNGYGFKSTTN